MRKPPPTRLIRISVWVAALLGFSIVASVFRSMVGLEMAPFEVFFHVLIFTLQGYILCFILHVWRTEPNPAFDFFNEMRRRMDEDFRRAREQMAVDELEPDEDWEEDDDCEDDDEDWDDDDDDCDYEDEDDDDDDYYEEEDDDDWDDEDDCDDEEDEDWDDDDEDW